MKVTIASIATYIGDHGDAMYMSRTYGNYILWAKKPEQPYVKLTINDAIDYETIWLSLADKKVVPWTIKATEIAADFMQYANLKNEGGMIIEGDEPTAEELKTMHENRSKWIDAAISLGDKLYGQLGGPGIAAIPDYCKRAAVERGEYPEWAYRPTFREQCGDCGTDVKMLRNGKRPRICFNCKSPLTGTPVVDSFESVDEVLMATADPKATKAKK